MLKIEWLMMRPLSPGQWVVAKNSIADEEAIETAEGAAARSAAWK